MDSRRVGCGGAGLADLTQKLIHPPPPPLPPSDATSSLYACRREGGERVHFWISGSDMSIISQPMRREERGKKHKKEKEDS